MLVSHAVARGIAEGTISLVFRRWHRPNVAVGDTLRTVAGVIAVEAVTVVEPADISQAEAAAAGADSPRDVVSALRGTSDQPVYQVAVHWTGPDPREGLSAETDLTAGQITEIHQRLATLDRRTTHGAWTHATLRRIADCPGQPARELADALGRDTDALKLDIRKLKNLGLTHSLQVGYQIAPRGAAYLTAIADDE